MTGAGDCSDGGAADDQPGLRVLHVDGDRTVLSRVAAVVEREYDAAEVVGATDAASVEPSSFDALVVEQADPGVDAAELVEEATVPVVLYTDADPGEIDEAVFAAADSLVEKRAAEAGLGFVADKIVAAARAGPADGPGRLRRAFDPVGADARGPTLFLVYEDGTVIWESDALKAVFDRRGLDVAVPDVTNFYRKLAAVLSHDPEAVRTIRGPDVPAEPTRFRIGSGADRAHFRYAEHEFPDLLGPVRLAVVEDVTWTARAEARLELLELFDERVRDGVSVVDADGRIAYHNDAFAALLGREDMVGEHASSFMADGELEAGQRAVEALLADPDHDSAVVDLAFQTADGDRRTLSVHFAVRHCDGKYAGLVNIARDVAGLERSESPEESNGSDVSDP